MALKQTLDILEVLSQPNVNGKDITDIFQAYKGCVASYKRVEEEGSTDFVTILIKGKKGKFNGGQAPTLGIIGQLGGIGARPNRIGFVSDGDGAVAALTAALKLAQMNENGDLLAGDVYVTTHICPNAPTIPHEPVEFMGAPVSIETMNKHQVLPEMDAIISVDTTKGNKVFNQKGIAISPTVKSGYILKFSDDLVHVLEVTTGKLPVTFAITDQDITPYGNGLFHINSIMQPSIATDAPVIGLAIITESTVPGSSTGASHEVDIAQAARFSIECAIQYTNETLTFYDAEEFKVIEKRYGSMKHMQTLGEQS